MRVFIEKNQTDNIEILKTIWKKTNSGTWEIHGLKGIKLKPRHGYAPDYFKIKDEMNLMTQTPGQVDNFFTSFGTTEFLLRQSIVPVVAWNDGDEEVKCIGTGFFISASGLLITAAHVLRDPIDENYAKLIPIDKNTHKLGDEKLCFGILLAANPAMKNAPVELRRSKQDAKWFMCPFEWAQHWGQEAESPLIHQKPEFKLQLDIAICKVVEHPLVGAYQPLNIGLHNLKLGDRAVAIGYAEMRNIRLDGDDYQPELVVSVGSVTMIHPDNITERKSSTPGPNFEFDAKIPGKMSGSPILVGGGIITKGVVSRSWQNTNYASGCLISPTMSLPLIHSKSLLDMIKSGEDGIAQAYGRGL